MLNPKGDASSEVGSVSIGRAIRRIHPEINERNYFMRERRLTALVTLCAVVAATLLVSRSSYQRKMEPDKDTKKSRHPRFTTRTRLGFSQPIWIRR